MFAYFFLCYGTKMKIEKCAYLGPVKMFCPYQDSVLEYKYLVTSVISIEKIKIMTFSIFLTVSEEII